MTTMDAHLVYLIPPIRVKNACFPRVIPGKQMRSGTISAPGPCGETVLQQIYGQAKAGRDVGSF